MSAVRLEMITRVALLLCLAAGIFVSQLYVVGFTSHRFLTPSWFFIGAALLLLLLRPALRQKGGAVLLLLLSVLTWYVGLRSVYSVAPSLALREYPLICFGGITFLSAIILSQKKGSFVFLLGLLAMLFFWQLLIAAAGPRGAAFLFGPFQDLIAANRPMYGFFQHHNPFASYCALSATGVLALPFLWKGGWKQGAASLLAGLWIAFAGYGVFQSGSRLGMVAFLLSVGMGGAMLGLFTLYGARRKASRERKASQVLLVALLGGCLLGSGVLAVEFYERLSQKREASGSIEADLMNDMRMSSIGMGVALWLENPLFGNGPRSYYRAAPRLRTASTGIAPHILDPEMVHCDYVQLLADYGILGFVLAAAFVATLLLLHWRSAWKYRMLQRHWFVSPIITSVATAAVMIHALGDFTLHVLPVFLQYSLIMGLGYGWTLRSPRVREKAGWSRFWAGLYLAGSLALLAVLAGPQIQHALLLHRYDRALRDRSSAVPLPLMRQVAQQAPDSFLLEGLSTALVRRALSTPDPAQRTELLAEAYELSKRAYSLHPHYLTTIVNYADLCLTHGDLAEARGLLIEGFQLANQRWKHYHLGKVAERYLTLKGESLWKERQASLARAYFEKALQYNQRGYHRPEEAIQLVRRTLRDRNEQNLKVLDLGQVVATPNVLFFDGYGLQ